MSDGVVDLSLVDLALVYGLILFVAALARWNGIGQERDLLWSSLRMIAQLFLVGYLLKTVFTLASPALVLLILLVMGGFAVHAVGACVDYSSYPRDRDGDRPPEADLPASPLILNRRSISCICAAWEASSWAAAALSSALAVFCWVT